MSTLFGFIAVFVQVFGKVVVVGRFPDSFNRSLKVFETTTFSQHFLIVNFENSEAGPTFYVGGGVEHVWFKKSATIVALKSSVSVNTVVNQVSIFP